MVSRGAFILHDAVRPAVPDGAYEINVTQRLDPPDQSVDALDKHIAITGPRFTLPPDQALTIYPPANSSGAFSTRLPQIVLRRRTLPWERYIDAGDPTLPWLALVVVADGEGQLTTGQPVDTTGLPDPELRDSDTRDILTVSGTVVKQIFPTKQDLPWLCHVREVDLTDTELALGDDDGWLAVVLANRLPQPGMKYTACLVSLEGHGDDLPAKEVPANSFSKFSVYSQAQINMAAVQQRQSETLVDGAATQMFAGGHATSAAPSPELGAESADVTLVGARQPATKPTALRDSWSAPALPSAVTTGQQASDTVSGYVTGLSSVAGLSINPIYIDPGVLTYQFTVLKHWSFTCSDSGDFESLVRELDDGMLGTLPAPAPPPSTPGTPPGAPSTRPDPVITDTGHVQTAAVSRRGDPAQVWYRGPFSPRQILRVQPDDAGTLPLPHTADQTRRVGPDGQEDFSLAAAFEIGRLLAVSQPAVVAVLLRWRQDGYGQARLRSILGQSGSLQSRLLTILDQGRAVFSAGVSATMIGSLGGNGAQRLGPVRPLGNPGPDLIGTDHTLASVVAQGFDMESAQVSSILASGPAAQGLDPSTTASSVPTQLDQLGPADFQAASSGLAARVSSLAEQATLLGESAP
jgi:hypothetical protein